jgi:membrane protease subunit (stomatin/prohibitin family)
MAAVQPDDEGDNDDSTAAAAAEGVAFRGVTDIAGSIKSNQHAPSSQQQQQAQQQQQQQQHMLSQPQRQQQQQQQNLCVLDWGVAHATLEEVFIKLAKHVGAKAGN